MDIPWAYVFFLGGLWFLLYWVFGGAFFALVSVFRLGRLKKLRFSCLFSLVSMLSAGGAAWWGVRLAETSAAECLSLATTNVEGFVGFFGCSVVALTMSFFGGVVSVLALGALVLRLSSSRLFLPNKASVETTKKQESVRRNSPLS